MNCIPQLISALKRSIDDLQCSERVPTKRVNANIKSAQRLIGKAEGMISSGKACRTCGFGLDVTLKEPGSSSVVFRAPNREVTIFRANGRTSIKSVIAKNGNAGKAKKGGGRA